MLTSRPRGFTLIELAIGLALIGLLLTLAAPGFRAMLDNTRLRTQAESILTGLQAARSEALKRNRNVEFLLTDDPVSDTNFASADANTSGPGWLTRVNTGSGFAYVDSRSGVEASSQAVGDALTTQIALTGAPGNIISFDGVGRANLAASAQLDIARANPDDRPELRCIAAGGPMRCLRIVVFPAGRARLCDPSVTTAGDTRAC